jgi:DNA repair exonuclease SbcCD nuclease subunit
MKILHTADIHCREKDIDEINHCLNFILATAETEKPDLAVIAGDVFDSRDVKIDSRSARAAISFVSALADICPVAIVLGTPSHDGQAPEIMRYARGNCPIRVASTPEQIILSGREFLTEEDNVGYGLQPDAILTLIPTPTKQFFQTSSGIEGSDKEIGQAMSGLFAGFGAQAAAYPGVPHIMVGHWSVNGCRLANGQIRTGMDIEVSVDQMNLTGAELHLLGHIHKAQQLGERTFYSGPIYSTKIDEEGPMGFYIHEFNKGDFANELGVNSSLFVSTPCKRTVRLKADHTDENFGNLGGEEPAVNGCDVRMEITEWQDKTGEIDKEYIKKTFMASGAISVDIRINAVPRQTIRAAAVLEAETLKDEIAAMAELRGETIDPEILVMAEMLEHLPSEELLREAGGAYPH